MKQRICSVIYGARSRGSYWTATEISPPNFATRQKIAVDTISRSSSIAKSMGVSNNSKFTAEQLPALEAHPGSSPTSEPVAVVNSDSFTAARILMDEHPEAIGRTAVLNLASDQQPGGGWDLTLSTTQEEALCYSSTLFSTLKKSYYPWPNRGPGSVAGVFSPAVVIFKDDLDHGCVDLPVEDRRVVSVITVAAPRRPPLTDEAPPHFANEHDLEDLRGKIRLVYRMAAHNGQEYLILGAMGCGAYGCPPSIISEEMRVILCDPEFRGWFKKVVFAIYSTQKNGQGNFEVFKQTFANVCT